jgi:hypothetical protein
MARSAASIQAQIDVYEAALSSGQSVYSSISSDGTSRSLDTVAISAELRRLYRDLGRANGSDPMIVRGVLRGLRQ